MSKKTKAQLKAIFVTGHVVSQQDMVDLIDSGIFDENIASASSLGVIKIGDRLSISESGELSADEQSSHKSYIVSITQSGTNEPSLTEIYNDLGEITLSRVGIGEYIFTGTNLFVTNKTVTTPFQNNFLIANWPLDSEMIKVFKIVIVNNNSIKIFSYDLNVETGRYAVADSILNDQIIEIKVYN